MATTETQHLDEVIASSRRKMLTLGGAALAGLALTSVAKAQTTLTDADYLNFALNLEYLEANFYTLAATGQTIDQVGQTGIALTGVGTQGTVTTKAGGPASCKVPFKDTTIASYATEIALEERNHVAFLRGALSTAAVAQPAIDLLNSFNGLAKLLNLGLTAFDPFADDASFLLGSYIFEDVGVTAYTGAAPALQVASNLDAAAGIQGVEAYHAGLIRTVLYGLDQAANPIAGAGIPSAPAGTLRAVATAISALRATVDGTAASGTNLQADDIGLTGQSVMLNGTTNVNATSIVDATTTGSINIPASGSTTTGSLVFARSAAQVLKIVYAGGSGSGGFFPAGLNGNVK